MPVAQSFPVVHENATITITLACASEKPRLFQGSIPVFPLKFHATCWTAFLFECNSCNFSNTHGAILFICCMQQVAPCMGGFTVQYTRLYMMKYLTTDVDYSRAFRTSWLFSHCSISRLTLKLIPHHSASRPTLWHFHPIHKATDKADWGHFHCVDHSIWLGILSAIASVVRIL